LDGKKTKDRDTTLDNLTYVDMGPISRMIDDPIVMKLFLTVRRMDLYLELGRRSSCTCGPHRFESA
jgi:hypothetical protein